MLKVLGLLLTIWPLLRHAGRATLAILQKSGVLKAGTLYWEYVRRCENRCYVEFTLARDILPMVVMILLVCIGAIWTST